MIESEMFNVTGKGEYSIKLDRSVSGTTNFVFVLNLVGSILLVAAIIFCSTIVYLFLKTFKELSFGIESK